MKVLLISANPERSPYPVFPIGISYVARALEPVHTVRLFDPLVHGGEEALPAAISAFTPDLVGISLRNMDDSRPGGHTYLDTYRRIVAAVRAATPAPVVLGGAAFTLFPEELMAELGADYGVVGEGEHLRLLVDALDRGEAPDGNQIPGLCLPGRPPAPPRPWKGPAGHGRAAMDLCAAYQRIGGMVNLQTKRGCPMRCIYCTYPGIEGCGVRNHPVEALVDDLEGLVARGARYFFFVDSVFNVDLDHTARLAEEILRRGVKVSWGAFFAPYRLPADYVRLLRASGLTHAEFGTESLSDPVLREYGKPFTVAEVEEAHRVMGEAGVFRAHFLLLGGPGETTGTVEETLAATARLTETLFFPFVGMRIYPGTPLQRRAVREGTLDQSDPLLVPTFYRSPHVPLEWLEERVLVEAARQPRLVLAADLEEKGALLGRLHARGRPGPLWEYLIR